MSSFRLFMLTMPHTLARFGLALAFTFSAGLLMLFCLAMEDSVGARLADIISALVQEDLGDDGPLVAMFTLWLTGVIILRFLIMHYAGYLLKAGHIAVLGEILATGAVPEKQLAFGRGAVLRRFGSAHAYLALDRLVDGAVSQLCGAFSKAGESFEGLPGVAALSGAVRVFLKIALGHVDECCLAFSFGRNSGEPLRDAADSIVLYFQNWRPLLKNAIVSTLVCCVLYAFTALFSLVIFAFFLDAEPSGLPAAFAGVFFFIVVKMSFIDNWVMIKMVSGFLTTARDMRPATDLYGTLAGFSAKFANLVHSS